MPVCNPDLLKSSEKTFKLAALSETNIFQSFGCMPSCSKNDISLTMVKEFDRTKDKDKSNTSLRLRLYYMDGTFDVKEEYYIYDRDSFMADCGGYLGLLLGASLLSLYHMISEWIATVVCVDRKIRKDNLYSNGKNAAEKVT